MLHRQKIAAFSSHRVVGLLNSAAYAQAAFDHTSLTSSRFSSNDLVNIMLAAITGRAGFPEIEQNVKAIEIAQRRNLRAAWVEAEKAISAGPSQFVSFLENVQSRRDRNLSGLQALFRRSNEVGNSIAGDLGTAIRTCAAIQLGSTVFLATTPVGLTLAGASSAFGAGMVGFGYSVTKNLAKDLVEAKSAGVIAFDVSPDVGKKIGDLGADKVAEHMAKRIETQADVVREIETRLASLGRAVESKVSHKKIAKLGRKIDTARTAMADAGRVSRLARYGKLGARSLQIVFAAHDVYEGWEDFEKVWNAD